MTDFHLETVRTMRGRIIEALTALGANFDASASTLKLLDELSTEAVALNDANASLTLAAGQPDRAAVAAAQVAMYTALETLAIEARAWFGQQRIAAERAQREAGG